MEPVTSRLARFASTVDESTVPPDVVSKVKTAIIHGLVVAAAGRVTEVGRRAEAAVGAGVGPVRLWTSGGTAGAGAAAFVNASLSHARGQEDTHGTAHLGSIVLPAAFAVAEETDADGATLLAGVVAGYEVGAALASRYTARSSARAFRASPNYGVFAAAAAVGRILGLDEGRLAAGLAFAAAFAGGTLESFAAGTTEWHHQNGIAAQNGLIAARLGAAGAPGAALAIEGEAGFLAAVCGGIDRVEEVGCELGADWHLREVTFKHYPVCAFNQLPVVAAARIRARHGIEAEDVESLTVSLNAYEARYPGLDRARSFSTTGQTLMSLPYCVALGIVDGTVSYADLHRFDDERLLALASRTTLVPEADRPPMTTVVVARMRDGRVLEERIDDPVAELTWSFAEARDRAIRLLPETGLSEVDLDVLLARVDGLAALPRAADVLDPIVRSPVASR